jgi:flagella basal body P-ring formation protein FlgA
MIVPRNLKRVSRFLPNLGARLRRQGGFGGVGGPRSGLAVLDRSGRVRLERTIQFCAGLIILVAMAPRDLRAAESAAEAPRLSTDAAGTGQAPTPAAHLTRRLEEDELREMLKAALGQETITEGGEWELKLGRPWPGVTVPDEPLKLEITQPAAGRMTPTSILAFELRAGHHLVGTWQMPVQARLYREVLVAHANLQRGTPLADAALGRERRDVLAMRGAMSELPTNAAACELGEGVPAGSPLLAHAVRPRPVVLRGQTINAVVSSGALLISLRVEALEEGIPGQLIRVRNPESHRELRGKIQDEHTIAIPL